MKTYLSLVSMFGVLSLLSIGGGNTVLPEMHLQAVNGHHWLTNGQFADIFSISHHEHRSGIEPLTGSARSVPMAPFRFAANG